MTKTANVATRPACDICLHLHGKTPETAAPAAYDGKTIGGPWAYMCADHFPAYGIGLGLGRGQKLIVESETK